MDSLVAQTNMIVQTIALAALLASMALRRKRKYFAHGTTMLIAVMLNTLSFLLVMMPSLLNMEIVRTQPMHWFSLATMAHAGLGAITIILSLWIVAAWHLQSSNQNCITKRKLMRLTMILWLLAFLLGFLLYAILNTNLIP
ncbi:hypothetical protein MUO74_08310 [Candidatus Bathyarchaeota archaeon]|nr:hypothetical protein [Candidatus Bathyarchaeota archaeon]